MDPKHPEQPTHEEDIAFRDAERAMGRSAMQMIELFEGMPELEAHDFDASDLF